MLPSSYSFELTEQQNYFGDTFDAPAFVRGVAECMGGSPEQRDYVAAVAANHVRSVIEEVESIAGRNVGLVESALTAAAARTKADLEPDAMEQFVAEHAPGMRDAIGRRRAQLTIRLGVIAALGARRAREQLFESPLSRD